MNQYKRNYESIRKRGLITDKTKPGAFFDKVYEEIREAKASYQLFKMNKETAIEIIDVILACENLLTHYHFDIDKLKDEKIGYNEIRKDWL